MSDITIKEIQGTELHSPYAGRRVSTRGVVTGVLRRGFFLQTPDVEWDAQASDAIFVYSPEWTAILGAEIELDGEVVDYIKHETAKPVTQLFFGEARIKNTNGPEVVPLDLKSEMIPQDNTQLAQVLNSLEGMLLRIPKGQTFIAPSNLFGDYVLALDNPLYESSVIRTVNNGAIAAAENPQRWFPGFRVTNYNHAPRLSVGATLACDVVGPLNYRVDAYQLSVNHPIKVDSAFISLSKSSLKPTSGALTVMTLNCFNLDPHTESASKVKNPNQDVDDDWGEGRFHTLAQAVVLQANTPDIIALQEIQDNDGAEISDIVDASDTYNLLIKTIKQLSGIQYGWVDVPPEVGADGGQPGGNIRNGYLYNPQRVDLVEESVEVFADDLECFIDSRKPVQAIFIDKHSSKKLACINVHLASKRHQNSIFDLIDPGVDAKLSVRIAQASAIRQRMQALDEQGIEYYVTGDFNDTEHSQTLAALTSGGAVNLVHSLAEDERYDYNHRGKLQVLMHGIVSQEMLKSGRAEYEIIHGNELIGVTPGEESDKPSDHAYVIAKLTL